MLGISVDAVVDERRDVEITLADDPSSGSLRVADVLFATPETDWLTEASLPRRPLALADVRQAGGRPLAVPGQLPVLYGSRDPLVGTDSGLALGIDVFGGAFFLLSRYEEIVPGTRDGHGRFQAAGSLLAEERLLDRPLVDEYVELLWAVMLLAWPRLQRRRRHATLRLSHDVDLPVCRIPRSEALRLARRDLRRERAPGVALRRLATSAVSRHVPPRYDLYYTFGRLMRESESLGLRSAFYFMAGNTGGAIDGNYCLHESWALQLLGEIHRRGHEIGLHPSYNTFRDPQAIHAEFQHLRAACSGQGSNRRSSADVSTTCGGPIPSPGRPGRMPASRTIRPLGCRPGRFPGRDLP